jgi:hypothetical protein
MRQNSAKIAQNSGKIVYATKKFAQNFFVPLYMLPIEPRPSRINIGKSLQQTKQQTN